MKLKKKFNKIVSWVLCLAMVFNLMPVFPALGAAPAESEYQNHSGFIFGYERVKAESTDKMLAKVTVYAHNVDYSTSHVFRFKFDESKLDLALKTTGAKSGNSTFQLNNAIVYANVPQSVVNNGGSGSIVGTTTGAEAYAVGTKNVDNIASGQIGVGLTANKPEPGLYNVPATNPRSDFKFQEGELVELFSMYFAGKTTTEGNASSTTSVPEDLDRSAFGLYTETGYWTDGSDLVGFAAINADKEALTLDDPLWIGFKEAPKPSHAVTVTVKNFDESKALNAATVVIDGVTYGTNSSGQLTKEGINVTDFQLEEGQHSYTVTPGAADADTDLANSGTFEVTSDAATHTVVLKTQEKVAGSFAFDVKVVDGDNGNAPLAGASVIVDGASVTTNDQGIATVTKKESATAYAVTVSKTGYASNQGGTIKVVPDQKGALEVTGSSIELTTQGAEGTKALVTVVLKKLQKQITVPVKDADNQPIPGAIITVTDKTTGEVVETFTADESGNAVLNLPEGDYNFAISASGYESGEPIDLTVGADKVTIAGQETPLKEDGSPSDPVTLPENSGLAAVTTPLYVVKGEWTDDTRTTMTVTVEMQNVNATWGTFGLSYDTKLFDNITFEPNASKIGYNDDTLLKNMTNPTENTTYGHHMFTWRGLKDGNNISGIVDASASPVLIGTYTLKVKADVNVDELLNNESLFVVPVEDTDWYSLAVDQYKDSGAMKDELVKDFTKDYWRTADDQNRPNGEGKLPEGRIDIAQATGRAGSEGFYQVFLPENSSTGANIGNDIRTQITFPNPENNIKLDFIVTNVDTKAPIENAVVKIYKEDGETLVDTLTTDARGEAYYTVDSNTNYKYIIEKTGFWPYPGGTDETKAKDLKDVAIGTKTVTEKVELKAKTYHPVELSVVDENDQEVDPATAEIAGETIAFNGVEYSFNINPVAGYEWAKDKPAELDVTIKEAGEEGTGGVKADVTLKAAFDKTANCYKIPGASIVGDALGLTNDEKTELDETLQAGDIIIKIVDKSTDPTFQKVQYKVTATAGAGGKVTSNPAAADGSAIVQTGQTIVETLAVDATQSATYTFTPDPITEEGYHSGIYEVVINGVAVSGVEGLPEYKYQFTNVTSDQVITVTFGKFDDKGEEPPVPLSDPVVTVIGSEFGKVTVDGTDVENGDRKDFTIGKTGDNYNNFVATITPQGGTDPKYVIDKVVVDGNIMEVPATGAADATLDLGNGVTATLTPAGQLTISGLAAGQTHNVAATFKTENGEPIQVIVTSSVGEGMGTITPFGISIYNKGDKPTYTMTAEEKYELGKVTVDGKEVTATSNSYQMGALESDTAIVANFAEQTFSANMTVQFYLETEAVITPANTAKVTFVRESDKEKFEFKTDTPNNGIASVEAKVPVGTWTITVHKDGYLDYTITGFEITGTETGDIYFGAAESATEAKPIQLTIGEANRDGRLIALSDAAQVTAGLLTGATDGAKAWANLDDNDKASIEDMSYVKSHFGRYLTQVTYDDFKDK